MKLESASPSNTSNVASLDLEAGQQQHQPRPSSITAAGRSISNGLARCCSSACNPFSLGTAVIATLSVGFIGLIVYGAIKHPSWLHFSLGGGESGGGSAGGSSNFGG